MSLDRDRDDKATGMRELLRTTDVVLLTYVTSLLEDAGVAMMVADGHVSSVEGSIGAFPRRVLVAARDWSESVSILKDAGLGDYLPAERANPGSQQ
jgi:hypothetical protein